MTAEDEKRLEEIRAWQEKTGSGNDLYCNDCDFLLKQLDLARKETESIEFLSGVTAGDARYASNKMHDLETKLAASEELVKMHGEVFKGLDEFSPHVKAVLVIVLEDCRRRALAKLKKTK